MAFTLTDAMNFKPAPVHLYVASWGPNQWVCHDYGYGMTCPLVFRGDERKMVIDHKSGETLSYAYHISQETGHKDGVEYITRVNEGGKVQKAKLWNTNSMTKAFLDWWAGEGADVRSTKVHNGTMDNHRNDTFAVFSDEFEIGVHIARPDNIGEHAEDMSPIWFSYKLRGKIHLYLLEDQKMFMDECKAILMSKNETAETIHEQLTSFIAPSPFQYTVKLSYQDNALYQILEQYGNPNSTCPITGTYADLVFLMGKSIPTARPCCVNNFVKELLRNYRESDTVITFKSKMYQTFLDVPGCGALHFGIGSDPDDPDSYTEEDREKFLELERECWKQTSDFLDDIWERFTHQIGMMK